MSNNIDADAAAAISLYEYDAMASLAATAMVMIDKFQAEKKEILTAIADYLYSEGCGCCEDREAHEEHRNRIGKLLNVPMYSDGSGYDFSQFRSTK